MQVLFDCIKYYKFIKIKQLFIMLEAIMCILRYAFLSGKGQEAVRSVNGIAKIPPPPTFGRFFDRLWNTHALTIITRGLRLRYNQRKLFFSHIIIMKINTNKKFNTPETATIVSLRIHVTLRCPD